MGREGHGPAISVRLGRPAGGGSDPPGEEEPFAFVALLEMSTNLPLYSFSHIPMAVRDPWGVGEHRWSCSHEETLHYGEMQQPHGSHHLPETTGIPQGSHSCCV